MIEAAYFSPGNDIRNAIIHQIKKARFSIDICVFTISDNIISNEIIKSFQRGIRLRIITDNNKTFDRGSDIEIFRRVDIPVKVDKSEAHMHHKFAIIDEKKLITGSFNWTRSASTENNENIIITDSARLIKSFTSEFNHLWEDSIRYE